MEKCKECSKELKELEINPNGLCDKCIEKIADETDLSCFDDI